MSDENISAIRARLKFESLEDFAQGYARYISSGGLFIPMSAKRLKPVGALIRFQFLLADGSTALLGEGIVHQVREKSASGKAPVGMLVKFTKLSQTSKKLVDRIVLQKRKAAALVPDEPHDQSEEVSSRATQEVTAPRTPIPPTKEEGDDESERAVAEALARASGHSSLEEETRAGPSPHAITPTKHLKPKNQPPERADDAPTRDDERVIVASLAASASHDASLARADQTPIPADLIEPQRDDPPTKEVEAEESDSSDSAPRYDFDLFGDLDLGLGERSDEPTAEAPPGPDPGSDDDDNAPPVKPPPPPKPAPPIQDPPPAEDEPPPAEDEPPVEEPPDPKQPPVEEPPPSLDERLAAESSPQSDPELVSEALIHEVQDALDADTGEERAALRAESALSSLFEDEDLFDDLGPELSVPIKEVDIESSEPLSPPPPRLSSIKLPPPPIGLKGLPSPPPKSEQEPRLDLGSFFDDDDDLLGDIMRPGLSASAEPLPRFTPPAAPVGSAQEAAPEHDGGALEVISEAPIDDDSRATQEETGAEAQSGEPAEEVASSPRQLAQTASGLQVLAYDDSSALDESLKALSFVDDNEEIDLMFDGIFGGVESEDDVFGDLFASPQTAAPSPSPSSAERAVAPSQGDEPEEADDQPSLELSSLLDNLESEAEAVEPMRVDELDLQGPSGAAPYLPSPQEEEESLAALIESARQDIDKIQQQRGEETQQGPDDMLLTNLLGDEALSKPPDEAEAPPLPMPETKRKRGLLSKLFGKDD